MIAKKSHEGGASPGQEKDELHEHQTSGTGAASALERMKALHALRHKHHGPRSAGPGHEEDRTPER
jgi:hypothetical protein